MIIRKLLQYLLIIIFCSGFIQIYGQNAENNGLRILRTAIHVFQDSLGNGNFSEDSSNHIDFLNKIIDRANYRMANLDSMKPAYSSPYVKDIKVKIQLDTIYFTRDNFAWNADSILQSGYMDSVYVQNNPQLVFEQKHKTLHIFIAGNYHIIGGHVADIGDKRFIASRGIYHSYQNRPEWKTLSSSGRFIVHELCHALGLHHNFQGGPSKDQCDECEDNGCPVEGSSNNIMDYWPGDGTSLSECQYEIINKYLFGEEGNISHVVINDSCYKIEGKIDIIDQGENIMWTDLKYLHGDILIKRGGKLTIYGTVSIPENCSITIEAGGNLLIDGGKLTNLCGDLWDGIVLLGDPSLPQYPIENQAILQIRNNSIIENSKIAVLAGKRKDLSGGYFMSGGIIEAEESVFKNNIIAVKFSPYDFDNSSFFRSCSFEITRPVNHFEEDLWPEWFISLNSVKGLEFIENRFINNIHEDKILYTNRGGGIFSMDATYSVGDDNLFMGLYYGIKSVAGNSFSYPGINNNLFINNYRSIYLSGLMFSDIRNNNFEIRRHEESINYGIYLDNCSDYIIENNKLFSVFGAGRMAGFIINGSSCSEDLLYNNNINNFPVGILIQNADKSPAVRETIFERNYLDLLFCLKDGKGLGLADSINYPFADETFTEVIGDGGYKYLYRSDHNSVYIEYPDSVIDRSNYTISDKTFFSDPFPQYIKLPGLPRENYSYDSIILKLSGLDIKTDSLKFELTKIIGSELFMSDDELIYDIKNEISPPVILIQKLINNIQFTGNQEVKNSLENRFGQLPAYMLSPIISGSKEFSPIEKINSQIEVNNVLKRQTLIRAVHFYLNNLNIYASENISRYLQLWPEIESDIKLIFWFLSGRDFEFAIELMDKLSEKYNDTQYESKISQYLEYFEIVFELRKDKRTYFDLTVNEAENLQALRNSEYKDIANLASNVLDFAGNKKHREAVFFPEKIYSIREPQPGRLSDNDVLKIYPNPTFNYFMIEFDPFDNPLGDYRIEIVDISGRRLQELSMEKIQNLIVNVENFQSGVYYCNLLSGNNLIVSKKIIVINNK
ncbi:T9SS type A sorting domain-containing protein [Bacteroidota bacterium]